MNKPHSNDCASSDLLQQKMAWLRGSHPTLETISQNYCSLVLDDNLTIKAGFSQRIKLSWSSQFFSGSAISISKLKIIRARIIRISTYARLEDSNGLAIVLPLSELESEE